MSYLANKDRDSAIEFLERRIQKYKQVAASNKEASVSLEMLRNAKRSLKQIKNHPEVNVWNLSPLCVIID